MTWTQSGNIKGASGTPGSSGAQGASGVPGASGPTGATGASGGTGGTGGPGTTNWADIVDKPGAILNYKGTWNASSNSPTLSDATGSGGDVYRVSVGASRNLGSGTIVWDVGDYAIWSPVTSSWEKADTTDAVSSVAGRTGAVTLTSADLGASGTASASTFLRGDNTWSAGPIGATGATGASGGTGGTGGLGASGPGFYRVISTITAPTSLGASGSTDYVYLLSSSGSSSDANVTLLLHADGANGSTTFTDSSLTPKTLTATSATISTTQSKFGGSSIYLNGSARLTGTNSDYAYGSSDWTAECWFYPTSLAGDYMIIVGTRPNSGDSTTAWSLGVTSLGQLFIYTNTFHASQATGTITTNAWFHIAAARQGSTVRLYVNGSQVATGTMSSNLTTNTLAIGANNDGSQPITGYVDELRLTKSEARYTSAFTAPTAAFSNPVAATFGTPTLPNASSNSNRYAFRNISGSSITVGASGSQLINGATGGLTLGATGSVELISDGASGWYAI